MIASSNVTSPSLHPPDADPYWVDITSSGIFLSLLALATVAVSQPACVPSYSTSVRQPPSRAFRFSPLLCALWVVGVVGVASVVSFTSPTGPRLWNRPLRVFASPKVAAFYTLVTGTVYYYVYFDESSRKQTWWAGSKIG